MTYIQNLFSSRDNNADGSTYVGQTGRLWWNPDTNSLYYSDGSTPGGIAVGAGGNPFNQILNTTSSVTFANINITDTANLTNLNVSGNINFATTGNIDLGNLRIYDQTIEGTVSGRDINLIPLGTANVNIGDGFNIYSSGNLETVPVFAVENSGKVTVLVTDVANSTGAVEIIGSTDGISVTEGNPGVILHMTGADGTPSRVYNDGVNNYPIYIGRRYNGTALAPTGVLQNQVINRIGANPYLTDSPGFTPLGVARMDFVATENQTTTAQGSRIVLTVTPTGSNTSASVATFDTSGIVLAGNLLPATDDVYSLGNPSQRWVAAHFGNAGIYIQDNTLGDDGQLQLDNGILNFDNIDSLRVGNLQFTSTGIITTINPALDVLIGNPGDTGNTVIRNAGIKFTDNTIQTTAAIPLAQKGNALGVVPLNASTKIDPIYLPAGAITFKGVWDAANNSPTLADGTGTIGDEYIVGVAGNINLGSGNIDFSVGDFVLYSTGNIWVDIPVGGAGVDTFNGRSGIVTLLSGDVTNALSDGSIVNSKLQNPNITVSTGTGLGGGQVVPLGGTITLTNTGVTGAVGGTGVAVSAATGNVTFSIGQAVGTGNTVQFAAISSTTTIQATGNITGGNLSTGGQIVATGNIRGGNIITGAGTVLNNGLNTTGNVTTTAFFIGNGSLLTGLNAYGNVYANGTAMTAGNGSATLTVTPGNNQVITGNNTSKVLTIAVSDNPTFANVVATGNITATNFIGNIISATNISNVGNLFVQGAIQYNLDQNDGGNVTQLTNKSTPVTCNGRTGRITTSGASLGGSGSVTFTVNNTYVEQYDLIILNVKDPVRANTYHAQVNGVGTNSFNIMIRNVDNNSHSDAIVLSFAVIQVR
jgi:hypothetical protein